MHFWTQLNKFRKQLLKPFFILLSVDVAIFLMFSTSLNHVQIGLWAKTLGNFFLGNVQFIGEYFYSQSENWNHLLMNFLNCFWRANGMRKSSVNSKVHGLNNDSSPNTYFNISWVFLMVLSNLKQTIMFIFCFISTLTTKT